MSEEQQMLTENLIQKLKDAILRGIPHLNMEMKERIKLFKLLRSDNCLCSTLNSNPNSQSKSLKEIFSKTKQPGQDFTKSFTDIINVVFYLILRKFGVNFEPDESDGYDYLYEGVKIEDKNSICLNEISNSFTGNGFNKTSWHILKKFKFDLEKEKITACGIYLVNLSKCKSAWTEGSKKSNYTTLKFKIEDKANIHCLYGDLTSKRKYLNCSLQSINPPSSPQPQDQASS